VKSKLSQKRDFQEENFQFQFHTQSKNRFEECQIDRQTCSQEPKAAFRFFLDLQESLKIRFVFAKIIDFRLLRESMSNKYVPKRQQLWDWGKMRTFIKKMLFLFYNMRGSKIATTTSTVRKHQ